MYSRLAASQSLDQRDCFELARNLPWQDVGCARHKDAAQARLKFVFNSLSLEFAVLPFFVDECVSSYFDWVGRCLRSIFMMQYFQSFNFSLQSFSFLGCGGISLSPS